MTQKEINEITNGRREFDASSTVKKFEVPDFERIFLISVIIAILVFIYSVFAD